MITIVEDIEPVATWIVDLLDGNAAGIQDRVYRDWIPDDVVDYPAIRVENITYDPSNGATGRQLMATQLWMLKIYDRQPGIDYSNLRIVAQTVNTILTQGPPRTIDGVYISKAVLDGAPPQNPEQEADIWWLCKNLRYKIWTHQNQTP